MPVAVVIPAGHRRGVRDAAASAAAATSIQLLADVSDPVAPQMVYGLLQKVTHDGRARPADAGRPDAVREQRRRVHARSSAPPSTPGCRGSRQSATRARRRRRGGGAAPMGIGVETIDVMRTTSNAAR